MMTGVEIDRNGLEVLDRGECLSLLATAVIGRIAVTDGALPTVLPVNFRLDGDRILIRTGEGSKLEAALHGSVVAFEVDDFDPVGHSGWSVVVTGVASLVATGDDAHHLAGTPLPRWAPVADGNLMAVSTELVSGRRLDPVATGGAA